MIKEKKLSFKQLKRNFANNKSSLYFTTLGMFLLVFITIFLSGMASREQYDYQVIELYEPQPIHSEAITVVKRDYNPENNLYRMDVFISSENNSANFSDDDLKVKFITKINPKEELKTEVIKVTNQYYTIYISDVPANYGAIRTDIDYFYDENNTASIQIYSNEEQITVDEKLTKAEEKSNLIIDSIKNDIRLVEVQKEENKKLMRENREDKINNIEEIDVLKEEIKYQVGEEVNLTNSKIESLHSANIFLDEKFDELKEQNKLADQKIKLLEEKINDVKEN